MFLCERRQIGRLFGVCVVSFLLAVLPDRSHAQSGCAGDCNGDNEVKINELVQGVSIALGNAEIGACPGLDRSGNGQVEINELISAVNNALNGCPTVSTPTRTATAPVTTPPAATPTPTRTAPPQMTATPTATSTPTGAPGTPTPVIKSVAGGSVAVVRAVSAIPNLIAALVSGIQAAGGASGLAEGSAASAQQCALGGTAEEVSSFPNLRIQLTMCEVPRPDGSVLFDGTITVTITNPLSLSGTARLDNLLIIFKNQSGETTLETTADVTATVRLRVRRAQQGEPCSFEVPILGDQILTGLAMTLNGGLTSETGGQQVGLTFQNTQADLTINQYGSDCVPLDYVLVLNGAATVSQTDSAGVGDAAATATFNLTFTDFMMDSQISDGTTEVDISGTITSACFAGTVTLRTVTRVRLLVGEFCPDDGNLVVEDIGQIFYSNGSVSIDDLDPETPPEEFTSCLAQDLACL